MSQAMLDEVQKEQCMLSVMQLALLVQASGRIEIRWAVQMLSTRKRKDVKIADIKVQVYLFAFDCLYLNGKNLLSEPLTARREALTSALVETPDQLQFAQFKVRLEASMLGRRCGFGHDMLLALELGSHGPAAL